MSRLESAPGPGLGPGAGQRSPWPRAIRTRAGDAPRSLARWQRRTLGLLRAALAVHLALVAAQPTLAGMFLSGDVDAIAVHATVSGLVTTLGLLVAAGAVGYGLLGGRWWPAVVSLVMFTVEGFQISLGHSRDLDLHIPLGVAITVCAALLAAWSWTAAAARVRRPIWVRFR